ncbi:MAG: class E sortase [Egibacteraceae bacterium]
MTQQLEAERTAAARQRAPGWRWFDRLLSALGWLLIALGTLIILYLIYSLFFTNLQTQRAQHDLAQRWESQIVPQRPADARVDGQVEDVPAAPDRPARPDDASPNEGETPARTGVARPAPAPATGEPVAKIEFVRPGAQAPPVHEEPLYIVQGVGTEQLQQGPGHYPGTSMPGAKGNFAVAGHRTTYGAPFYHLDQLGRGDRVRVTDARGRRFVYTVRTQRVVAPSDVWVIQPDPLETGRPTLTLTTCHPRFSAAERLVVFAELGR